MNKHQPTPQELEEGLQNLFPQPDPQFLKRLEMDLMGQAARPTTQAAHTPNPLQQWLRAIGTVFQTRRLVWVAAVLLIVTAAVSAIGPGQVLAGVQRLLGYVPGVGFVEPAQTRYLVEPVSVQQGDVTLRVEKVVANEDYTQVIFTAEGFPRQKFGPEEETLKPAPHLLLPDGTQLGPLTSMVGLGDTLQATMTFHPLPAGVDQITLVLPSLPNLPEDFAPGNWTVPLHLQIAPGNGEETPQGTAAHAYLPSNATASDQGVTARVLQVGQSAEETGLEVEFAWENRDWLYLEHAEGTLQDEHGRLYDRTEVIGGLTGTRPQAQSQGSAIKTFQHAGMDPAVRQPTLSFERLIFNAVSRASFNFDPGKDPKPGQVWQYASPAENQLNLAGVPVQVLEVALLESGSPTTPYRVELLLQALPTEALSLRNISQLELGGEGLISFMVTTLPGDQFRVGFDLEFLPGRSMTIRFTQVSLVVEGSWVMAWERE
jgi:hypothetical protein